MASVAEDVIENPTDLIQKTEDEETKELNEFSYLETGGFSSELFKIEIKNMPKFYGISELKKLLNIKLQLKPGKIKPPNRGSSWLYVCFRSEADRQKAVETLNGYKWKGKDLKAQNAQPAPDPLVRKRKLDAEGNGESKKGKKELKTQEEQIKDITTPYWNVPYEKQVEYKHRAVRNNILKMGNELWKAHANIRGYIEAQRKKHDGLMCEYGPLRTAETIDGYRNKCEFTVGMDEETKLPTVGFRIGSYVTGFTGVAPVAGLCHISEAMKASVLIFQDFVRSSSLKPYSPMDHSGHWSQLMIRQSFNSGDLMLVVGVVPQDMSEENLAELKKSLVQHFTADDGNRGNIKSLYFQVIVRKKGREAAPKAELLWGETHIYEKIHNLNFRISPEAFFQINTAGAEKLYQTAIELADPQKNSTVLDICCGTGTIGLCFAKHCDQVLGLELVPEAITDAKFNAASNNITNADFFVGRAEDILTSVVARATNSDVIAIVDPPRAGLHMRAITQLRHMKQIKKLIFLSCDPSAATKNFIDLGRARSKTMHGDPFIATKAVAVDMFPHTKHTELVLLFERVEEEIFTSLNTAENTEKPPVLLEKNIKSEELNIKSEELNIKSEELNIKSEELNIKSEELNIKSEELNIKSEELNIKSEELNIKSEELNIKSEENDKIDPVIT